LFPLFHTEATFLLIEEPARNGLEVNSGNNLKSSEEDKEKNLIEDEDEDDDDRFGKGKEKLGEYKKGPQRQHCGTTEESHMVRREVSRSTFYPLAMTYYTKDDVAQSYAFYSPIYVRAAHGTNGDGCIWIPPYFASREGGGPAAGGSEKRVVVPFYFESDDRNSRTLAVLPFYLNTTNLVTKSRLQMLTPAW